MLKHLLSTTPAEAPATSRPLSADAPVDNECPQGPPATRGGFDGPADPPVYQVTGGARLSSTVILWTRQASLADA